MSNHQNKASSADIVGPLLKRLNLAKDQVTEDLKMKELINQISTQVEMTKKNLGIIENFDRELVGHLGKIERQIDPWIDEKPRKKKTDLTPEDTTIEGGNSSNGSNQKINDSKVPDFMYSLDPLLSRYLKSLLIFPENTELKKRLVIYWWTVLFWGDLEYHERLFSDLVEKNVLKAVDRKHNNAIDRFTMEPIVHKLLISNSEMYSHLSSENRGEVNPCLYFTRQVLLNQNERYLKSKDIMEISRKNGLEVVQLGSWRYPNTEVHMGVEETGSKEMESKDHIEVDQTDFLEKLGKDVKCLSLRGISGITELHESIGKLEFLKILDLRACHNLEKLPHKPGSTLRQALKIWALNKDNGWFKNLTVFDISECYLLDSMPKWVCELYNLKVLKGFVVSSLGHKNHSCQIGDLRNLHKLRKLTIRIVMDRLDTDIFEGFNNLDSLLVLTITWGETKYEEIPTYSLPKNLEKLDIRCYPEADALKKLENPEKLEKLKRLYIRGGNLVIIPCHDNWKVEILRLRFLGKLVCPTNLEELTESFVNLKYVEYVKCPGSENFPKDEDSWHKCISQEDKKVDMFQKLVESLDLLHPMASKYLKSLLIFPENTKLKKRLVIYWWSGLFGEDTETNEKVFSNMVHEKVFIPVHREHNNVIDCVTIEPIFLKLLLSKNERYGHPSFEERAESSWYLSNDMLINLDQMYLDSNEIMYISTRHDFKVVQLGNWLPKTESQLNDHIELDHTKFLKKIGKHVNYLSLRGILGISELHESIGKLEFLKILDLRGCNNLEILPPKPPMSIIWFNSLTVLDISECYLLEHMPKWVCELKNLEVLKGFLVGSLGNKNQSCLLCDLAKLRKLRKLSIKIIIHMLDPDDFQGFHFLDQLLVLTITWRGERYNKSPTYSLPKNLEKLDIRCDPATDSLMLQNPEELTKLKRLYIRFGNISRIPCHKNWNVEILRLRFLEKLVHPKEWNELTRSFKNLRYVEYVGCDRPINFPNNGNIWRIEE